MCFGTSTRKFRSNLLELVSSTPRAFRDHLEWAGLLVAAGSNSGYIMKRKKIETHKIGLVGQAPSRRGDPRKPLAGPNGRKIARLAGMSYDELIACRRRHLNPNYSGKRHKGDGFDDAKGYVNAADVLLDWRVERIVLLGKNVARCFGLRDLPFLAEMRIYGRRFLLFPHPSGANRWWNERRNERRARRLLQRFLRGETVPPGDSARSTRQRR
jgi:hypothetical protein